MESVEMIKNAGLKVTPQRKMIYEAMMHLRHASIEDIVSYLNEQDGGFTISTVYRVLDSFCKSGLLGQVSHPETGKCYYDITVREHNHIFSGQKIIDYEDNDLSDMIMTYLGNKDDIQGEISRIQIQIIMK